MMLKSEMRTVLQTRSMHIRHILASNPPPLYPMACNDHIVKDLCGLSTIEEG